MTLLKSQFSFWIANFHLQKIRPLRGARAFPDLCSDMYSHTKWQLHSKCLSYLVTTYAQHAKNLQKLPLVPFLTCAFYLCSPSTLPSIFNVLAMASRKKRLWKTRTKVILLGWAKWLRLAYCCVLPTLNRPTKWMPPRGLIPSKSLLSMSCPH